MRRLGNTELLDVWERGIRLHPLDRALLLLAMALPETPSAELADWPLGRRNRALAKIRCDCFGPNLKGWLACPHCGEKLEFQMNAQSLIQNDPEKRDDSGVPLNINGLTFRLPTSRDLALAAKESDPAKGAARIAESCRKGPPATRDWSTDELSAIGESMALADPLAETRLAFRCPGCEEEWEETLDISSFCWTEIEARARRILMAIHTLASAYGWSESEILSLSETRRAWYLEMAQA